MQQPESTKQRITVCTPKDFEVSYFCGSGAGGQARNKVHSGVQIKHTESGAIGRASDTRSQHDNKRAALERLTKTPQFKFWLARKLYEIEQGETLERTIERELTDENLRYEIKNASGQWEQVNSAYFDSPAAKEQPE
jgi:protein subunit release factor B